MTFPDDAACIVDKRIVDEKYALAFKGNTPHNRLQFGNHFASLEIRSGGEKHITLHHAPTGMCMEYHEMPQMDGTTNCSQKIFGRDKELLMTVYRNGNEITCYRGWNKNPEPLKSFNFIKFPEEGPDCTIISDKQIVQIREAYDETGENLLARQEIRNPESATRDRVTTFFQENGGKIVLKETDTQTEQSVIDADGLEQLTIVQDQKRIYAVHHIQVF